MCWWRTGVGHKNSNKLVRPQGTTWSSPPCFSNPTLSARNKRHCSLCRFSKLACHLKGRTSFSGPALLMRSCVTLSAKQKALFLLSPDVCSGFSCTHQDSSGLSWEQVQLSAGFMFSCCPTEETSWQELKFQQVNPVGKHLLRMFWFPAPGSPGAQKPAAGAAKGFCEEKLCSSVLSCLLTCQPGQSPHHCRDWECGDVYCGIASGQLSWNHCKSLYFSVTFFLETRQNHFKQQQNPFLYNLTNLPGVNQSCMKRTCAPKG